MPAGCEKRAVKPEGIGPATAPQRFGGEVKGNEVIYPDCEFRVSSFDVQILPFSFSAFQLFTVCNSSIPNPSFPIPRVFAAGGGDSALVEDSWALVAG
jgi:hypothetical protein